ncbi:MAG: hypothetical protein WC133_02250 [Candidatus Omnitrophota bacterium]
MQCLLENFCFLFPKYFFLGIGGLSFALGFFSVLWPQQSIGFYQWVMERINWKVAPIDLPREIRNTRILGAVLVVLSLIIFFMASSRFKGGLC